MRLTVDRERAERLVASIPHSTCAAARAEHWTVSPEGIVRAQSILWLFCWAKTGMNSDIAREVARAVFDEIMPVGFSKVDAAVDHEYARLNRYAEHDIEAEFERMLAGEPLA